jgi:hypothetical protein
MTTVKLTVYIGRGFGNSPGNIAFRQFAQSRRSELSEIGCNATSIHGPGCNEIIQFSER